MSTETVLAENIRAALLAALQADAQLLQVAVLDDETGLGAGDLPACNVQAASQKQGDQATWTEQEWVVTLELHVLTCGADARTRAGQLLKRINTLLNTTDAFDGLAFRWAPRGFDLVDEEQADFKYVRCIAPYEFNAMLPHGEL